LLSLFSSSFIIWNLTRPGFFVNFISFVNLCIWSINVSAAELDVKKNLNFNSKINMAESPLKYKIFDSKDMAQSICAYIFIISSYFFLFLHPSLRVDHHQIMNLFLHFFFHFLYFTSSRLITWTIRIRSSQCLDHENPSCFLEKLHHFWIGLEPNTFLISYSSSQPLVLASFIKWN
jgi:hypothetical protein